MEGQDDSYYPPSYSDVLRSLFQYDTHTLKDAKIYRLYPPNVLVGNPPRPMNIEYEKKYRDQKHCIDIRMKLYYEIQHKFEETNENEIKEEKTRLEIISRDLALFAQENNSKTVTKKLMEEFLRENEIDLVWRDSRDILRIRAGLVMKRVR